MVVTIVMENGYWPEHDPLKAGLSKQQADANRQWFAGQWELLILGGVMETKFGFYQKTERGFRRCSQAVGRQAMLASKEPKPQLQGDNIFIPMKIFSERLDAGYKWNAKINIPLFRTHAKKLAREYLAEFNKFHLEDWYYLNDAFSEIEAFFDDRSRVTGASAEFLCAYYNTYPFPIESVSRIQMLIPDKPLADHRIIKVMIGVAGIEMELPELPRLNVWKP